MLRFLLVGDPVSQSRSPAIHAEALRLAGLEGEYGVRRSGRGDFAAVVAELADGRLDGVNVTMPLKGDAYEAAEERTHEAERAASVNTLRFRGGRIEGHSTDVVAFQTIFDRVAEGADLLLLGAGGSARAALAAWTGDRAYVSARDRSRAAALGRPVPWGEPVRGAVVVNATPLGMAGERIPEEVLAEASLLVDLPYGREVTPAVARAEAMGMEHFDGLEFLALQAAAAFQWWTGARIDSDPLIEAARNG